MANELVAFLSLLNCCFLKPTKKRQINKKIVSQMLLVGCNCKHIATQPPSCHGAETARQGNGTMRLVEKSCSVQDSLRKGAARTTLLNIDVIRVANSNSKYSNLFLANLNSKKRRSSEKTFVFTLQIRNFRTR